LASYVLELCDLTVRIRVAAEHAAGIVQVIGAIGEVQADERGAGMAFHDAIAGRIAASTNAFSITLTETPRW
jgi:hypothetical protein